MPDPLLPMMFYRILLFLVLGVKNPKFAVSLGRDAVKYHMAMDVQWKENASSDSGIRERCCTIWCSFCLKNQVSQLKLVASCMVLGGAEGFFQEIPF